MSIDNKQFDEQIMEIGREIYEKVSTFVKENKGRDSRLYNNAILKLGDGREMVYPFKPFGESNVKIWNYQWNDELQRGSGDAFGIMLDSGYGFLVDVHFYYLDKENLYYTASEKDYPYNKELTDEEKEDILLYLVQLQEQIPTLVYDKEATHTVSNYTYEAKHNYNIRQYNKEMKKLSKNDPESTVLPSVETAVNWWIIQFMGPKLGGWLGNDFASVMGMVLANDIFSDTQVTKDQLLVFRKELSKVIMEKLSKGYEVDLKTDYSAEGILADAMIKAKISGAKCPMKTQMYVGVNSVRVSAGYQAEIQEIYAIENKDEDPKKNVKKA